MSGERTFKGAQTALEATWNDWQRVDDEPLGDDSREMFEAAFLAGWEAAQKQEGAE